MQKLRLYSSAYKRRRDSLFGRLRGLPREKAHEFTENEQDSRGQIGVARETDRGQSKIERTGAAHPYTSLNGMFTYLDQTGTMGLRLPKE
jgi:hypothetical protein